MDSLIGRTLDKHYQVVRRLGGGGMGVVYEVTDIRLKRQVALKVMHTQYAEQPVFQERFLQEAQAIARLDHQGVVKVYDFGQVGSVLYIAMEFIPGANLRQLLTNLRAEHKWIVLPEAVQLVRQVCLAMDYVHRKGVLHRDLKPDNIMFKPDPGDGLPYRPVLTDLGLAKLVIGGLETQAGIFMGTLAYMSPEQALAEKIDARSDIYSLGVLLYELAVGQLPFQVKNITEAIRAHTQQPPPLPRSLRPELPVKVQDAILTALAKNPAQRFADAGAFAQALAETVPATEADIEPPTEAESVVSLVPQYAKSLAEEPEVPMPGDTPPESDQEHPRVAGRIGIVLQTRQLSVEPGSRATAMLVIVNQGPLVDHFVVSVTGTPASWVSLPAPIQLLPGKSQTVSLGLEPPRTSQSAAGEYPLTIRVASEAAPEQAAQENIGLEVKPFYQFTSELRPLIIKQGRAKVTISNLGNTADTFSLKLQDQADELVFNPSQPKVTIGAGESKDVAFRAKARTPGGLKQPQETHILTVGVSTAHEAQPPHSGQVLIAARDLTWILGLTWLLLRLVGIAIVFGLSAKFYTAVVAPYRPTVLCPIFKANLDDLVPGCEPTPTPTPTPDCSQSLPTQLSVGMHAASTSVPSAPINVYDRPGNTNQLVGIVAAGQTMTIVGGPECADKKMWWKAKVDIGDLEGWLAESGPWNNNTNTKCELPNPPSDSDPCKIWFFIAPEKS